MDFGFEFFCDPCFCLFLLLHFIAATPGPSGPDQTRTQTREIIFVIRFLFVFIVVIMCFVALILYFSIVLVWFDSTPHLHFIAATPLWARRLDQDTDFGFWF